MALTIYERAGGFVAIRRVVSDFYDRVLDSPVIAHHFADVEMARLIDHQTRFVSFLLGGPVSYSDEHLVRIHRRLRITIAELDEMIALMCETLEDHDFAAEDVATVERELRKRESVIVTVR